MARHPIRIARAPPRAPPGSVRRVCSAGPAAVCPGSPSRPPVRRVLYHLYTWTLSLAAHPRANWALALVAFAESSFFPIPPDVMVVPMVLANRARALWIAAICTAASVAGGIAGYLIGALAFEAVGRLLIEFYGAASEFERFREWYGEWGLAIVFAAGLTPLPYKVFTIASGVAALNPLVFVAGSIVSRGIRFFAEAGLLWLYGEPIRAFIEGNLKLVTTLFVVVLVGGFLLVRFVF